MARQYRLATTVDYRLRIMFKRTRRSLDESLPSLPTLGPHPRTGFCARAPRVRNDCGHYRYLTHHRPGDLPRFALVGGPATQLISHAESTVMKTNASFDAHA